MTTSTIAITYSKAVMDAVAATTNIISYYEGMQYPAEWDVNAWRLGFGSDTEGPDQVPVKRGMTTTWDRAIANLAARVPAFLAVGEKQIGADLFAELGVNTRAVIGDLCYNYGSIPENVLEAFHNKSKSVAAQIKARSHDNNGINAARRYGEAAIVALDGGQVQ